MIDNRLYWIWLQQALEPGGVKTALALSAFASPEAIHRASRAELMRAGFTVPFWPLCRNPRTGPPGSSRTA